MASIAATTSMWSPLANVTDFLPKLPSPSVNFGNTISNFWEFIGTHINIIRDITGCTRIIVDIKYIVCLEFLDEETPFGLIGGLLSCISDFGSILPLLHYWKVIDLDKIASTIGQKVRFLAPLMKIPIENVLGVITSLGYFFYGVDAVYRLFQPQTKGAFRRQALLDVANSVVQIALSSILIAGVKRLPVLLPMGAFCMVVGSTCFLHRCTLPPKPVARKRNNRNLSDRPSIRPISGNELRKHRKLKLDKASQARLEV